MEIQIKYNGNLEKMQVKLNTKVSTLINKLAKKYSIDAGSIKLIFRGKQLTKAATNKLSDENIKQGDKLLLTIVEKPGKGRQNKKGVTKSEKKRSRDSDFPQCDPPEIIMRGPPPGALPGMNSQTQKLPTAPFVVYTKDGKIAKLSIESDALFISYEDGTYERLFDISYHTNTSPLEGHDGYISLHLTTKDDYRVFYYIPKQYQDVFKQFLTSLRPAG